MDGSCYVNKLLETIQCPVDLQPLFTAVNLFPCNHNVNEAAAKKLYGECASPGSCEKKGIPCPVCRGVITSYGPDHTVRQLASLIFGNRELLNKLPESPLVLEERPKPLPFPGKPVTFVHTSGDWEPFSSGGNLCRHYQFKSITLDSVITEFSLCGYHDGSISIFIDFPRGNKEFVTYLRSHGIIIDEYESSYLADTPESLKTLFRILAENNEIPKEYYEKLRAIVEKGSIERSEPSRHQHSGLYRGLFF